MYCPKCGKKLPKNATLCSECDIEEIEKYRQESSTIDNTETTEDVVKETTTEEVTEEKVEEVKEEQKEEVVEQVEEEVVEQVEEEVVEQAEESKEETPSEVKEEVVEEVKPVVEKPIKEKKKRSFKWVKYVIALFILIGIGIGGYFAYKNFIGFEKLSWDKSYGDYKLEYITPNEIKLAFEFSNEEKYDDVKVKATCGSVKVRKNKITWDLTEALGDCKIEAKYKSKKITKKIKVIDSFEENIPLSQEYEIDYDSDEDLDYDGFTNKEEKALKTDPELADTDADGLDDYFEVNESKTDPLKADTDGDGLSDYDELELDLDPLKADSKGDGVKDGQRKLTYEYENENVKLTIKGKGNIASVVADVNPNTKISGKKGVIDKLYTLYSKGDVEEATLTISYTDDELKEYGLNEDNLSIYYYNESEAKYEKIDSVVDKEKKTVTATLKHFSPYVVGDDNVISEKTTSQVLFVLDNSWSMYTEEQFKELTGESYSEHYSGGPLEGNDKDGLRFDLTVDLAKNLIDKGNKVGISEFRQDYANVLPMGSSIKDINNKVPAMNGKFVTTKAGTNTSNALVKGLEEFTDNDDDKYIIILTDGKDTVTSYNNNAVIDKALDKNVKICAIGFGEGAANTRLSNIANATGCKFYSSADAMGLSELFDNIQTELSDGLVDVDDDGTNDGILIADSGFIVNRDGFSFRNYASETSLGGHCFGMSTIAELYYKKVFPLDVEGKKVDGQKTYSYDLTDTYFKNYDNLYDYSLESNVLKYTFGFEAFGETQPKDYMSLNKKTLIYGDTYKKEIEDSGIYNIKIKKSGLDSATQKERWGVNYKDAENAILDEEKMQNSSSVTNNEKQMLNAIWRNQTKQDVTSFYTSSSNFILWARNVVGTEDTAYTGKNAFLNIMKTRLNDGDPLVISSTFDGGLHAINAINLIQDLNNPNIYYIGVYDNNYPGEKRYVTIECNQSTCATKANSYYSSNSEPIRITPSLEYDLEFYK